MPEGDIVYLPPGELKALYVERAVGWKRKLEQAARSGNWLRAADEALKLLRVDPSSVTAQALCWFCAKEAGFPDAADAYLGDVPVEGALLCLQTGFPAVVQVWRDQQEVQRGNMV